MSQWNWKPERTQGVWRTGPAWLRPFLSAVPWITVLLLVLMFHIVGGTLVSHLEKRAAKTERKTLLVLADKRVASGELIKFSGVAKRSGIERIFIAEKREGKSAE